MASGRCFGSFIDLPAEKAKYLDLGADDYLGKPFDTEELFACVRKVAALKAKSLSSAFEKRGNVLFDKVARRIFSKIQLLERIWDIDSDIESNVLETTVKNLRKKLQESGASAEILSKRNLGYWFEG